MNAAVGAGHLEAALGEVDTNADETCAELAVQAQPPQDRNAAATIATRRECKIAQACKTHVKQQQKQKQILYPCMTEFFHWPVNFLPSLPMYIPGPRKYLFDKTTLKM